MEGKMQTESSDMTGVTASPQARYTLELRDVAGGITARALKGRPPSGMPRLVVYGGGVFLMEHARLLFDQNGSEHWVGYYGEAIAFSADLELELREVFDATDLADALGDGLDQALSLANICTGCGKHWCGCDFAHESNDQSLAKCCAGCSHRKSSNCGPLEP